jgi:hypothetical protein
MNNKNTLNLDTVELFVTYKELDILTKLLRKELNHLVEIDTELNKNRTLCVSQLMDKFILIYMAY